MGAQAFQQLEQETPKAPDPKLKSYVDCVALPITEAVKDQVSVRQWKIEVFDQNVANAFALPGGEIGVDKGIFKVAHTDGQLATVIAHEVGHVVSKHGNERTSEQLLAQSTLALADAFIGGHVSPTENQMIMGLLGAGAQVGILLPFSRTQETEADLVGLQLMAESGFDPRQSIPLWQNMKAQSQGQAPPEWLSTHPADQKRIDALQAHLPAAIDTYNQARAAGRTQNCGLPPI